MKRVRAYSNTNKSSPLYLQEKLEILRFENKTELLNKISKIVFKCHYLNDKSIDKSSLYTFIYNFYNILNNPCFYYFFIIVLFYITFVFIIFRFITFVLLPFVCNLRFTICFVTHQFTLFQFLYKKCFSRRLFKADDCENMKLQVL